MPLTAGTRVGSYEVVSAIGAGGMGEVYRARDTRLGRDVALKILSGNPAADRGSLARFEREAKTLASLNHPHIAQIYGVEDLAAAGAGMAIVMELIDGDDLSARIARGPIAPATAVTIARQIVDALGAAHERGIVHRDLKPANVKVRPDGTVKVLDFGLARDTPGREAQSAPTITALTAHHAVLGTPAYMSPEQATGQSVDHRTDIWAFGCVLYEMLSGRQPFTAATSLETLAAVISSDPDWTAIASAPPSLQALVRRCLKKDARERVHHVADVRMWLDESPLASSPTVVTAMPPAPRRRWLVLAALGAAAAVGAVAMFAILNARPAPPAEVVRFEITPPVDQPFTGRPIGGNFLITPDGSTIVYHALVGETFQLMRRRLDAVEATPIAGTERAMNPAFSPDGQRLAFYSSGAIRTVPLSGGTPAIVCELDGGQPFLAWVDTGDIVFTQLGRGGLLRVPATGGIPEVLYAGNKEKGEIEFFGVGALPGGAVVTSLLPSGPWRSRVAVLARGTTSLKILLEDAVAQYGGGQLVFRKDKTLQAAPFDLDRLEFTGAARVLETVAMNQMRVADNGTYVYLTSDSSVSLRPSVATLGADGRAERVVIKDTLMGRHLRISPEGGRVAAVTTGGLNGGAVWTYDLRGAAQPIKQTFRPGMNYPVWTHDGRGIVFQSAPPNPPGLHSVVADGNNAVEPQMLVPGADLIPEDWSPNGHTLLYQSISPKTGADLMAFDRAGAASRPWLQTTFNEAEARFSPDGTLVAYVSDQTGRYEVWVRPFAAAGEAKRVSADGGHEPQWSADGHTLFFQSAGRMMSAIIERSPALTPGTPRMLFEGGFVPYNTTWRRTYGVLPDGRFVVVQPPAWPRQSLVVVMNALR